MSKVRHLSLHSYFWDLHTVEFLENEIEVREKEIEAIKDKLKAKENSKAAGDSEKLEVREKEIEAIKDKLEINEKSRKATSDSETVTAARISRNGGRKQSRMHCTCWALRCRDEKEAAETSVCEIRFLAIRSQILPRFFTESWRPESSNKTQPENFWLLQRTACKHEGDTIDLHYFSIDLWFQTLSES